MQPNLFRSCSLRVLATLLAAGVVVADTASAQSWHYQLIEGSSLVEDCHICERPAILSTLRGDFDLVLLEENPLFATYGLTIIVFTTGFFPTPVYEITGHGMFRIGGEVAVQQFMTLELRINHQEVVLTNNTTFASRRFPMLATELTQSNDTNLQFYTLNVVAAPMREFWFSTTSGFTPADFGLPRGSAGDILSSSGHVVIPNGDLLSELGFMPIIPEMAVDAVDVAQGGEVLFSLNEPVFSETLGSLQHGDILSAQGKRLFLNQQLLEPFGLVFDALDLGLDALHITDDGEVLFSITTDMESPNAGLLHRGDLLSNRGVKFRSYDQLIAPFHPPKNQDFGLDAVYVWPNGEVWFSTEGGFQSEDLVSVQSGDLLSDSGYIVARNLDIMNPFKPIEDLADFGFDGLFVITDVTAPAAAPVLNLPVWNHDHGTITLGWEGSGRVYQLQQSVDIMGPWNILSPIVAGQEFHFPIVDGPSYFRLRQW